MNYIGLIMKKIIKLIVSILGFVFVFTNTSFAEKKFVPVINDDLLTMVSYYTTKNNLQIPILNYQDGDTNMVVQCEDDIAYFIMATDVQSDELIVSSDVGNLIIDEEGTRNGTTYIKGNIEGVEPVIISSELYINYAGDDPNYQGKKLTRKETKRCRTKENRPINTLEVPTFSGNSQGKLVVQCENKIVYYIMAYDCLRSWTNVSVSTNNGIKVIDENRHVGEIFYEKGHIERTTGSITITGKAHTGYDNRSWVQTCP